MAEYVSINTISMVLFNLKVIKAVLFFATETDETSVPMADAPTDCTKRYNLLSSIHKDIMRALLQTLSSI